MGGGRGRGVVPLYISTPVPQVRDQTRLEKSQHKPESFYQTISPTDSYRSTAVCQAPDMRYSSLAFLLLLTCVCLTLAQGSYEDCCLKYVKSVPKKIKHGVASYRRQEADGGCNIPAIVFTLRRGRVFCADPSQSWAQHLVNRIDSRKGPKRPKRRG
ncbi:hypothetical protein SKAU_G00204840 [Synaphobranchus kaupii]|uniref:Chemokine interleukin-8-like domain-containing protein n=1 Tax=Synaphobranchus kaupii TaxID=118154 RepID=A0A9Q1FG61_SYNKA|nr:hypothetical protein SKAU_G00204840 [Synaphobranchus kaupii]